MRILLAAAQLLSYGCAFAVPLAVLVMMGKFLEPRRGRLRRAVRYGAAWIMCNNTIYLGDPVNILYALPAVFLLVWLGWRCRRAEWMAVSMLFYTLTTTLAAITDSGYVFTALVSRPFHQLSMAINAQYLERGIVLALAMLAVRRLLPQSRYTLSGRMWRLIGLLAVLPFAGILASVALVSPGYDENYPAAFGSGMLSIYVMLPLFFLTVLALLYTATVLASHEQLERSNQLAELREVYYQGLQQQETQVRRLRHDLRNHLTVIRGLLETGDRQGALGYLDQIAGSPALRGTRRVCENEAANVVLAAKAEAMEREGMTADFAVSLPQGLPVADADLCALLGNALDNAIEGSRGGADPRIIVRCKADKGLLMLRVENPLSGKVREDLTTTKADRASHGFGLPGMREIAERYGGTLEAGIRDGRFELVVCLPVEAAPASI